MPPPNYRNCRPGDVILFYGLNAVSVGLKAAKTLKILTVVPAVISAVQTGSAGLAATRSACDA